MNKIKTNFFTRMARTEVVVPDISELPLVIDNLSDAEISGNPEWSRFIDHLKDIDSTVRTLTTTIPPFAREVRQYPNATTPTVMMMYKHTSTFRWSVGLLYTKIQNVYPSVKNLTIGGDGSLAILVTLPSCRQ